jgi:hypothetical protein
VWHPAGNHTTPSGGHETDTDTVKMPATAISMVMRMSALKPWTNALAT